MFQHKKKNKSESNEETDSKHEEERVSAPVEEVSSAQKGEKCEASSSQTVDATRAINEMLPEYRLGDLPEEISEGPISDGQMYKAIMKSVGRNPENNKTLQLSLKEPILTYSYSGSNESN